MLETIRAFAAERLATSGEADDIRRRHAERMVEIARSANLTEENDEPDRFRQGAGRAGRFQSRTRLGVFERPGAGAPARCSARDLLRGACALGRRSALPGSAGTHSDDSSAATRERATQSRGLRTTACGIRDRGCRLRGEPSSVPRAGRRARDGSALAPTCSASVRAGRSELARRLVEDSERVARDRFRTIEAQTSLLRGRFAREDGDLLDAAAHFERSRELAASIHWGWWQAIALTLLADAKRRLGELSLADRYGRDALALFLAQESRGWCVNALGTVAQVALARGEVGHAGLLWGAMSVEGERSPSWHIRSDSWAGALPGEDRPEFAVAAARGRELDLWDAVALAIEAESSQTVP